VTPVLQLDGVGKTYRRGNKQLHVLVDFDFTLDAGEFVVVTGPSGRRLGMYLRRRSARHRSGDGPSNSA
jgi:ABC-type ATPase involved in cell division